MSKERRPNVAASKALSYVLRHGAEKHGLAMRPDGYVKLTDLVESAPVARFRLDREAVQAVSGRSCRSPPTTLPLPARSGTWKPVQIVDSDAKGRFKMIEEDGVVWIRANQGHTVRVGDEELLARIASPEELPEAVHATFWNAVGPIMCVPSLSGSRRAARPDVSVISPPQAWWSSSYETPSRAYGTRQCRSHVPGFH